jgi:mono/diheme cytochrome c family protein
VRPLALVLASLAGAAALGAAGAATFAWSGLYDISAAVQHTQPVYSLLQWIGERSIKRNAAGIAEPAVADAARIARGAVCYRDKCMVCHGGPGVAQGEIARSMQPLPGPLVDASQRFRPRELYWVIREGIKMSGMPAWGHRLSDADHWAVVGFLQRLPQLTPAEFRAAILPRADERCGSEQSGDAGASAAASGGTPARPDAVRGRIALTQYGCNGCHVIPGVTGAQVHVGPPLAGMAGRGLIAGKVENTLEHLAAWISDPQAIDPETAMPNMDVDPRDARDIAAYLGTLH